MTAAGGLVAPCAICAIFRPMGAGLSMWKVIGALGAPALVLVVGCGGSVLTSSSDARGKDSAFSPSSGSGSGSGLSDGSDATTASSSGSGGSSASSSGAFSEGGEPADAAISEEGAALMRVPGTCAESTQGLETPSSVAAFDSLLVGRWRRCSGETGTGGASWGLTVSSDEAGVEFVADGTWYTLTEVDAGVLIRSSAGSLTDQGTWSVMMAYGSTSAAPTYQFSMRHSAGTAFCSFTFSVRPTEFVANCGSYTATYVAVP